jgi:hypothetical protein
MIAAPERRKMWQNVAPGKILLPARWLARAPGCPEMSHQKDPYSDWPGFWLRPSGPAVRDAWPAE